MYNLLKLDNIEDYFQVKSKRKNIGVFFYRIIGYDEELLIFLRKYQTYAQRKGTYINKTLNNPDVSDIGYLNTIINNENKRDINTIKQECSNWLKFLSDGQLKLISESIYTVLNEIAKTGANVSIVRNAYIKFLYWLKYKFENSIKYIGQDEIPKVLYEGDIGKYELYMLRILSLSGCDVIYINFISEESYMKIDKQSNYSIRMLKQIRQNPPVHFSKIDINKLEERESKIKELNNGIYKLNTNKWLKTDFFEELYSKNKTRTNDKDEICNMFIKYVGIDNKDEYNNRLYNMKRKIKETGKKYVLIENEIPIPTLDEIAKMRFNYKNKEDIIFETIKKLNFCGKDEINKVIQKEFVNVINNIKEENLAKIYNIVIKLLCWTAKYAKKLFINYDEADLPIFIYYGNCNSIEATFICMLSKLPIDVIYINPNKENLSVFNEIITSDNGIVMELENSQKEKTQFPKHELKIRASTVAYNAERQLDDILYNDTGMYRNKQFKTCKTITLKTTYEEIEILWEQEAKYRPSFKTENNIVTVPNIFAKVCGVKDDDKNEYFKNIQNLITEDTILIKKLPYIKESSPNPFYSQASQFVQDGKINIQQIKKNKDYKFNFLSENTQNYILSKIQEEIDLKLILTDELYIEQKIVATILNLNKEILKLIQKFDFTKQIPKLIIIDTDENIASIQDCILFLFLNLIGFDIVIFTPTGYQNIEKYIPDNMYEEYQIGNYIYDLKIPDLNKVNKKQSFLDNIFKRRN